MDVSRDILGDPRRRPPCVVGVGVFDGVHGAHALLVESVIAHARERGVASGILTFDPHPQEVITGRPVARLLSLESRLARIERLGVDFAAVARFTHEFSRLSPEEFVRHVLIDRLAVVEIVVGFNFHFGRGGGGSPGVLTELGQRFGLGVTVIEPVLIDGRLVSSSTIRDLIADGAVDEAARLLGQPHVLQGSVETGAGRGRTLGFPTANLALDPPSLLVPATGVYLGCATVQTPTPSVPWPALVSVGTRPTFERAGRLKVEINLHGFTGNLVGRKLSVTFVQRLRDELKFADQSDLVDQMHKDREALVAWIESETNDPAGRRWPVLAGHGEHGDRTSHQTRGASRR